MAVNALLTLLLLTQEPACTSRMRDRCVRAGGRAFSGGEAELRLFPPDGRGWTAAPVTGARGEALTFTRASSRGCYPYKFATTSGQGTYVDGGTPCVTPDGYRADPASTQLALQSDTFTASVWYRATIDAGNVGPFGTLGAALILDGGLNQVVTVGTASSLTLGCLARAGTGTAIRLTIDAGTSGSTGKNCVVNALPDDGGWTPATCSHTVSNPATVQVACGIPDAGGGNVYVGAMGVWPLAHEGQYVRTTAASVAYNEDDLQVQNLSVLSTAQGCASATAVPLYDSATAVGLGLRGIVGISAAGAALIINLGEYRTTDDVNFARLQLPFGAVAKRVRSVWGSGLAITDGTETGTATFDGTMGSSAATVSIGKLPGFSVFGGTIRDVQLSRRPGGCR
ncbi:MAG: hypothetical protein SFW67_35515 [Myxococcaceae bacterium]|nr:hypothetical protein [Myxococcaceae bacterium]